MLILLIWIVGVFAINCNLDVCGSGTIGDKICSPSCMNEPCNFDSLATKFIDKVTIMKSSDCFNSCIWYNYKCTLEKLENNICDDGKNYAECNIQECAWDLGSCGYCGKNCFENMLGDGVCNEECFTPECRYDLGDCGWCSKDCKLEFINNNICNPECYNPDCNYDGTDCGCAPNCRFEDYGKCKPACMVLDCNYDSMGTLCPYYYLIEFYQYFQLIKSDFSVTQNIDFLSCSTDDYQNILIYSLYCPIHESYKSGALIKYYNCPSNCLKCTDLSHCVLCDYSNGYVNFFSQCVLHCPAGYSNHHFIPSICYSNWQLENPNLYPISIINPKKIYVDYNTTKLIQDGSIENPFKTLYETITNNNSPHIEILLKPGIHKIEYSIPINPIIISMVIRSDCSNCTEYAFLSIQIGNFTFPTYGVLYTTFVNLVIDRKDIDYRYYFYFDPSIDGFFCPWGVYYDYINLIDIASSASFYAVNTTFSNMKYNIMAIIQAGMSTIKLYDTNFINASPFNCPNWFTVIRLLCNPSCRDSNFEYNSGIVSLNNGYFSSYLNIGSSFLVSQFYSKIKISNVKFSNINVFGKWGAGSYNFYGCSSLFCIASCNDAEFENITFEKIYVQRSIIEITSVQNYYSYTNVKIFDNQLTYVWSSGQFLYVNQDARLWVNVDNLNISMSKFSGNAIYLVGNGGVGASIENIEISYSSFDYFINSIGNQYISVSSVRAKGLPVLMTDNIFSGVINNYEKIHYYGIESSLTSMEGFIYAKSGRAYISDIVVNKESLIYASLYGGEKVVNIIYLNQTQQAQLINVELVNIDNLYSFIIIENCNQANIYNFYISNINWGEFIFNQINYAALSNVTITRTNREFNVLFYDCPSVHTIDSYFNSASIEIRNNLQSDGISSGFYRTQFIDSRISFKDYINTENYEFLNCSFFDSSHSSAEGIVSTYFGTKNSQIITRQCHFYNNKKFLLYLQGGNYQDFNSKFEWNRNILSQVSSESPANTSFFQSEFYNNLSEESMFDASGVLLKADSCIFIQNIGLNIKASLYINNCTFSNNAADSKPLLEIKGSKNYIKDSHFLNNNFSSIIESSSSALEISNTSFLTENAWIPKSIILILGNKNVSIIDSSFTSLMHQTAIYSEGNSFTKIHNSTFKMAELSEQKCFYFKSGYLYLSGVIMIGAYDYNDIDATFIYFMDGTILNIEDSNFEGSPYGVMLINAKSVSILRSSFKNGVNSRALTISKPNNCYLSNLKFINYSIDDWGSSIYFTNMLSDSYTVLDYCDFEDNKADLGGAIFIDGCGINIQNSMFINNTSSDVGGAIVSLCRNDDEVNYFVNNTFFHNNATVGGAIYWEINYPNMTNNDFTDNYAKYGNSVASRPTKLAIIEQSNRFLKEVEIISNDSVCGLDYSMSFQVALVDPDGQITSYGYDNYPSLLKCESEDARIIGDFQKYPNDGIIGFNDLFFICSPGQEIELSLSYSGKIYYISSDKSYEIPEKKMVIKTRNCIRGEYMDWTKSMCEFCTEGKFSLDPSNECEICPRNAYCYGGDQIVPLKGYWRGNIMSSIIYPCPNYYACRGGTIDDIGYISLAGICAEGHRGNLCQPCDHKYSSSGRNKCKKCPSDPNTNVTELVAIFIVSVILLISVVHFSLKTAYEPKSTISVYFRILINYLQMIMFVARFKLNWPWYIDYWISSQGYPGEVLTHIVSIDCYLMDENDEDSYKTIYFKKMIIIVILPAALGIAAVIFWTLMAILKRKWNLLKNELIATLCITLFLILPSITDYMFSIFSCTYVYEDLYLISNLDIKCWKDDHLYYVLVVALPGIIVWTIGFPTCVFLFLYKRKYKLHRLDSKIRLGFLYVGYREPVYYWEFVIMLRKLIIICLTVFLITETIEIQVASCFSIFAIFFWILYKYYPFEYENLNKTELGSNFVVLVTTWCGLFYASNSLNETANIIFFLFILLSNSYFAFKWVQAMIAELKEIIIEKFPYFKSRFDINEIKTKKNREIRPIFSLVGDKKISPIPKIRIKNTIDLSILKFKENIRLKEELEVQEGNETSIEYFGSFNSGENEEN